MNIILLSASLYNPFKLEKYKKIRNYKLNKVNYSLF